MKVKAYIDASYDKAWGLLSNSKRAYIVANAFHSNPTHPVVIAMAMGPLSSLPERIRDWIQPDLDDEDIAGLGPP